MQVSTFKGGIHPPDYKELSENRPIEEIWPDKGSHLIFPVVQHIGAPCSIIVEKVERVLVGQKLADCDAYVSSPIHSSISGTVIDIRKVRPPEGPECNAVVIENDDLHEEHPDLNASFDYTKMTNKEIVSLVKDAGIVGLGGACFPTHVKLDVPEGKQILHLVVNGAECEPFLTTDYRIMLEKGEELIKGLQVILHMHPEAIAHICIEDNKVQAINKLTELTKEIPNIKVVPLETKYPQGAEKQLIKACLDLEVPRGGLPLSIGVCVINVSTAISIYRKFHLGRPLMHRIITITGDAVAQPGNYQVRLGMTYNDLLDKIGGFSKQAYKLIAGGPMMGKAMYDLDIPIAKGSSALIALSKETGTIPQEGTCIKCGTCVNYCPAGLLPITLNDFARGAHNELFVDYSGLDCMECGACTFVCPAKLQLSQTIRTKKKEALAKRKNK